MSADALLRIEGAIKHFPVRRSAFSRRSGTVHAVDGLSLEVHRGETVGLVGETGCGKSTLARCVTRLHPLTGGRIIFDGRDIATLDRAGIRQFRREVQMIFQDPYGALNPRRRVGSIIGDPLVIHDVASGQELKRRVQDLMEVVGLNPEHYNRFPAEFSGGQRQRIGVARALALRPKLIVCDEPVSALDVSIQAQIINLLIDLQQQLDLTYLFISHDLAVVEHVCHRVAVMYLGRLAETATSEELFSAPRHPYTSALLSATMAPDPNSVDRRGVVVLTGDVASPLNPPSGCRFHTRCPRAQARCAAEEPQLAGDVAAAGTHLAACHFPLQPGETLSPAAVGATE